MSFHLEVEIVARRGEFLLDVAFDSESTLTALFGPSGAGKTSVLDAIAGLLPASRGRVTIGGEVIYDSLRGVDLSPHRRRVGYVFQDGRLFPHLDVRDNLLFGAARGGGGPGFDDVVEMLEIGGLLGRRPRDLSGGEQRRIGLARALLSAPRLMLLDEPLSGVEHGLRAQILGYLARVRDELQVPMIYVSHSLSELLQLTDLFVVMQQGRVIGSGDYYTLLGDEAVFTLAQRLGMTNVLEVEVEERSPEQGLLVARLDGHRLSLPCWEVERGTRLRVGLRPHEVILASGPVDGLSVQNCVAGRVLSLIEVAGRVLVQIDIGQQLLAEVTPKARGDLGLKEGQDLRCLFKTTAIERLGAVAGGSDLPLLEGLERLEPPRRAEGLDSGNAADQN